jgi:hypothetical protein
MRRVVARLFAIALAIAVMVVAAPAAARTVRWTKVEAPAKHDAKVKKRIEKALSRLLKKASKRAKWGKGKKLDLSARITKLVYEEGDEVLRVSVTVVAKIDGGKGARSHIRLGGRPNERRKVEKDALKIVADGLVTRLSDIARRR